jgi:spore photoproduct lyase
LKSQNFRIQKRRPALILAHKSGNLVMPTPEGFGIGSQENYYFSHMLNCLYDCRYCFLQGMYPSAHYVIFINYEDFATEISKISAAVEAQQKIYFFSGYDCDSLAFETVTGFLDFFLPFFANYPQAFLELRTKSASVQPLLTHRPIKNSVIAFSLTPQLISEQVEHKVPPLQKRLAAMRSLAKAGWRIGLRFDPLIDAENFEVLYQELIAQVFQHISADSVHSVSIGPLRFPQKMYQKIVKLYPQDKLLAQPLAKRDKHYSYSKTLEDSMKNIVAEQLAQYISSDLLFSCSPL